MDTPLSNLTEATVEVFEETMSRNEGKLAGLVIGASIFFSAVAMAILCALQK